MVSLFCKVVIILLATSTFNLANGLTICNDVTDFVKQDIVGVSTYLLPCWWIFISQRLTRFDFTSSSEEFDEALYRVAERFNKYGMAPDEGSDYMHVKKTGTFITREDNIVDATRQVLLASVNDATRTACEHRMATGVKRYRCVLTQCFRDQDFSTFDLNIACVAKKPADPM